MSNIIELHSLKKKVSIESLERPENGYVINCILMPRAGEQIFSSDAKPFLDGCAIMPIEDYEQLTKESK